MNPVQVRLVKEMGYERIDCTCGMAVLPKDPTPELTNTVKKTAMEEGAGFSIIDTSSGSPVLDKYDIHEIPCVIIGENIYPVDTNIICSAIRKEKA
ncbi:MAG: hypothetical protein IBX39_00995 [Candidatus Methanoperedenaceae archaeon]|nr:hypothetical protein [Candidatus Methanoperedenaceae archaeon]MDW7726066.1 hypothetical protein [Candidatus Methanoperedens sp.]